MPAMDLPANEPDLTALFERIRGAGRNAHGDSWHPSHASIAPGRLELLGNHVDYNGGPVLAAAIDRVVAVLFDQGGDAGEIRAVAGDVSSDRITIPYGEARDWQSRGGEPDPRAYLFGAVAALLGRGHELRDGLRVAIGGDVPLGFGISSSAAFCVAAVTAIAALSLEPHAVVLTAQEAEHRAGTPCGRMDQTASVAGNVIRYDGADDSFTVLRPDLGSKVFAVADSGVSRSLGTSSYPQRVAESREALRLLRERLGAELTALGQLTGEQWAEIERHGESWLPPPLFARVRHVYMECERVRAGMAAMERADWEEFGQLMTESGHSSATDYEISHPRVEELAAEIRAVEGVLGARMMGGGEGGPALMLLHREALAAVESSLRAGYYRRYGMADRGDLIQPCRFGPGARIIEPPG